MAVRITHTNHIWRFPNIGKIAEHQILKTSKILIALCNDQYQHVIIQDQQIANLTFMLPQYFALINALPHLPCKI